MAERAGVNGIGSVVPPFGAGRAGQGTSSGKQIQSVFAEVAVDVSTVVVDPVFATLVSTLIVTTGGDIEVHFTCGFGATGLVGAEFRLLIDAVLQRSTQNIAFTPVIGGSGGIVYRLTGVAPGPHTVLIEWGKSTATPGVVLSISPVTNPNGDHASLLVHEVVP